jgi:hypothetical protein
MRLTLSSLVLGSTLLAACGGGKQKPADSAADATSESAAGEEQAPDADNSTSNHAASDSASDRDNGAEKSGDSSGASGKDAAEPAFTENMSVDEATRAVPRDQERRNIDQETLGKPLANLALYEPCKPGSAHVKFRVAVWNGKAVGLDVSTTPKNEKLANCIKERIREVTWDKKVKSLNTIEYQF